MGEHRKVKINYDKIKPLDIVFCGGSSPIDSAIRGFTAGATRTNDESVPTHCGMVVDAYGQKFIVEMLPGGLKMNSLEEYNTGEESKPYIIGVGRFPDIDYDVSYDAMARIFVDLRRTIEYDWSGDIAFVLPFIGHDSEKMFCSEYVATQLRMCGIPLEGLGEPDHISPYSLYGYMERKGLNKVDW